MNELFQNVRFLKFYGWGASAGQFCRVILSWLPSACSPPRPHRDAMVLARAQCTGDGVKLAREGERREHTDILYLVCVLPFLWFSV